MWKRGEIARQEQFLLFSTIFCNMILDFCIKTRIRFSLRDKRLFEITEVEITRVDCICLLGDFNARTSNPDDAFSVDENTFQYLNLDSDLAAGSINYNLNDNIPNRVSCDKKVNNYGYRLTELCKSRKENPQKLTQLSSRSHPRHLVGKRTAQKDITIDTTSDSQVNSNFPNRWSPASLTFNNYLYPRFEKVGGILVYICPWFRPSFRPSFVIP